MFFLVFFLFNSLELESSSSRKTALFLTSQAEEIQNFASTELHEWSKNVVNVESCNVLKVKR